MNQYKIILLPLLIFLLSSNTINSQNLSYGISANIGLSQVKSKLNSFPGFKNRYFLSGNYGAFIEKRIKSKSLAGLGVSWVQVEGKETLRYDELRAQPQPDQEIITIAFTSDESRLHFSYLGIPFYYKFAMGKFYLKGGFQILVFLAAKSDVKATRYFYGDSNLLKRETKNLKLDIVDLGPTLGVDYKINKNFNLTINYYHGITDITSKDSSFKRKNRQATLGVQYIFEADDTQ